LASISAALGHLATAASMSMEPEVQLQDVGPQGEHRDGAQADLHAVGERRLLVHPELLHLPGVGELVAGAGCRAGADAVLLHRQPGHHQALDQPLEGVGIAGGQALRVRDGVEQRALDQIPDLPVDGLDAELVGDDPVGPGRDLLDEIAQTGRGAPLRGGGHRRQVGDQRLGSPAAHGVLEAVLGDRGAEGGVAVHRGGGADIHVTASEFVGGALGEVVEGARADRAGDDAVQGSQLVADLLDVLVGGVEGGPGREDHRLHQLHPGVEEGGLDRFAGNPPGVPVGDDDALRVAEELGEHRSRLVKDSVPHDHHVGVVGVGQGLLNEFGHVLPLVNTGK
jgi:hypothetical protein